MLNLRGGRVSLPILMPKLQVQGEVLEDIAAEISYLL